MQLPLAFKFIPALFRVGHRGLQQHQLNQSRARMSTKEVSAFRVHGLICPPCTPFTEDGEPNYEIIERYVQHHLDFGIPNVFVSGTTGEGNSMTVDERKKMTEAWIKAGRGKLTTIIIHIGAGNLKDSQELARHAEGVGADAIACVSPTYHKPQTLDTYVSYMQQVAAAAPATPFYLYDIDFVTGVTYVNEDFFTKAKPLIPTLRGLKHTSPNFPSMNTLLLKHPGFEVFLGCNETFLQGLAMGIEITICSSFLGHVLNRLKDAYDRGDIPAARLEQGRAIEVCRIKKKYDTSYPGFTKAVLRALGLEAGSPRLPLAPVSEEMVKGVHQDLVDIGFFDWGVKK